MVVSKILETFKEGGINGETASHHGRGSVSGALALSQLGRSPNLNWDSQKGLILVPKGVPSWAGIASPKGLPND